ncbi:MAG: Holliday junction resolvase RuvX [Duodenibacillus sp.]|nr:Holliday junction resolvase RuvX [Duodenibacillus sp.]
MPCGVILGFDYGALRIGVAAGNTVTGSAAPLAILDGSTNAAKWQGVAGLVEQWEPSALVVGVPRHPDGAPHALTARAMKFARQLEGRVRLPVYVVDERYSSAVIGDAGGGPIDDAAAAVILQQWFDEGCPERKPGTDLTAAAAWTEQI